MFNFLKRTKDKQTEDEIVPWGTPVKRKMSKDEAAREEAEQRLVEKSNKERRDMYRFPGVERIFEDTEGRRLAIRTEDNSGPDPNPEHAPVCITVFWGVRELGRIKGKLSDAALFLNEFSVERGFEGRGIAATLLAEVVNFSQQNSISQLIFDSPYMENGEVNPDFLAQNNFNLIENQLIRKL